MRATPGILPLLFHGMSDQSPDISAFERRIFRRGNVLSRLLAFSRKLMQARQAGLVYGTDASLSHFLPPARWDRGMMHKFSGKGIQGIVLKLFGRQWVRLRGLSPIHMYRTDEVGERIDNEGIVAYALRNHQDFYDQGIKILLIDTQGRRERDDTASGYEQVTVVSYDGSKFRTHHDLRANTGIITRFRSKNFIAAYIPDYGALVFNTVTGDLIDSDTGSFLYDYRLKARLDILILAIEKASLAYLGQVKGRAAAKMIWRKESGLRKVAARLKQKERLLEAQEKHLLAVGAVTPEQLDMAPVSVHDGVYAFMDMVGSAGISKRLSPRDYVEFLNYCHEIAAENAVRFGCRVDNIIGDGVFFLNVSVFDTWEGYRPSPGERIMLMTLLLASVINDIHRLAKGMHPIDPTRQVQNLVKAHRIEIGFRAGMSQGRALVGPLGSHRRKIVTAVGEVVDLASRLESSGMPNHIHTTRAVADQLEAAWISKDTMWIYTAVEKFENIRQWNRQAGFSFMEFYKTLFNITKAPVYDKKDSRYKEFFMADTHLIRCLPENECVTCLGI